MLDKKKEKKEALSILRPENRPCCSERQSIFTPFSNVFFWKGWKFQTLLVLLGWAFRKLLFIGH